MGSSAFLVLLLGALVLYQRFGGTPPMADDFLIEQPAVEGTQQTTQQATGAPAAQADGAETQVPVSATATTTTSPKGAAEAAKTEAPKQLLAPLAGNPKVVRPFAFMFSEVYGDFRLHPGIDYQAQKGESVLAAAAGKVIAIETDPAEGKVVVVDHGGGVSTRYGGLGKVLVGINAAVQPGSIIGQVGDPTQVKQTVGTHLHYEVHVNGNPVDPDTFAGH